ncbi:MAG: GAF domain-containing protein [Gammaproteobacteria bacterium]|nr:GAF domain-containing protein [Gammaproteobacteria bacterium]
MAFDTFDTENTIIEEYEALIVSPEVPEAFRPPLQRLTGEYKKLLKTTRRLVRLSDRSEEGLMEASRKIKLQQQELEKAHKRLESHAETLEEKVRERTRELALSQKKLERLVGLGISLSTERNQPRFMEMILQGAKELTGADGGILLVLNDSHDQLTYEMLSFDSLEMRKGGNNDDDIDEPAILLHLEDGRPNYYHPIAHAVLTERTVNVVSLRDSKDFDFSQFLLFDEQYQYQTSSLLVVPLKPRQGSAIGALLLVNARKSSTGRVTQFSKESAELVEALSSQAAVALDNKNLVKAQAELLDAIIKLTASAIDAKSPYTSGHCERVPEIGRLLAEAACESDEGIFADFDMSEEAWREFHLGAWLHDCGKVTTPEYVMDKSTKLETIYNRIHEIRGRFEILYRDHHIELLQQHQAGALDEKALQEALAQSLTALRDEYAFIAECNIGGEFMDGQRLERLQQIAKREWVRHFDDRLGLSHEESLRLSRMAVKHLPVREQLLSDKKEHIFPRPKGGELPYDVDAYGIKIKPPKHINNAGELYNLSIARGTLNNEERFKINEHIIQTIIMLDQLPFPKHLAKVPEIAANHHETMVGTGYPRQLKREEMSLQSRMMAIADIFEALTASDRPYKKPKTLSESLKIMSFMRNDGHIDPDLFNLFLSSGVYQQYAERFLDPEQIDTVNVKQYYKVLDSAGN